MAPNTASQNNQNGKVAAAAATANRVAKHIRENVIGTPKVKKVIDSAMNLIFFCFASVLFGVILIGSELATLCVYSGLNFFTERSKVQANNDSSNDSNNKSTASKKDKKRGGKNSNKSSSSENNQHDNHQANNHQNQNHED